MDAEKGAISLLGKEKTIEGDENCLPINFKGNCVEKGINFLVRMQHYKVQD